MTRPKLLILPSWYIRPDDRINGSFFQAQGRLMSEAFDTRVLFLKHSSRRSVPSLKKNLSFPFANAESLLDFFQRKAKLVPLPNEDVFNRPKLFLYEQRLPFKSSRPRQEVIISDWLDRLNDMLTSGWRPDLIRAHSAFPAGVVARRAKTMFGIPYAISEHMPFSIFKFKPKLRPEVKAAFECADLVLSLSYDKVRQLAMSDIDVEPNIIYNFVDEGIFSGLAAEYTPGTPIRLVTIGAASFYKDHKTLLRSLKILADEKVPFQLTMIGLDVWGGETREATFKLIQDFGLAEKVEVIGKLDRREVAEMLPKFNVFLMTSIQEGFPNAVLEALASGLFVVATRHGGTEDLVDDEMGRLTRVKDPAAIAAALKEVFVGEIQFFPSSIRRKVINVCGCDAYRRRLLGYYCGVLN